MPDNDQPFRTQEVKQIKNHISVFTLFYAVPAIVGGIFGIATQIITAGQLSVYAGGPWAGHFIAELSPDCMAVPACVEAAKDPVNFLPIILGVSAGIAVSTVIKLATKRTDSGEQLVINGTFRKQ